jgi:RND family efflux transporter MFP subunit
VAEREYRNLERLLRAGGASPLQVANQLSKLDMARAQFTSARAALKSAQLQKDYTVITSPFDATILDVSVKTGMSVTTSTELLKLADAGQREVELAVDTGDIADIHPQQVVELTTDALPDQKWQAIVLRIAPAVDSSKQGNTVAVRTSLPEDAPLKLGQQVDARVITAEKSAVPVLPFSAIKQIDGNEQAAVVSDGVVHWRKIETGIEDLSKVEIVSGIKAGDTVVTDPPDSLQDGERVKTGSES